MKRRRVTVLKSLWSIDWLRHNYLPLTLPLAYLYLPEEICLYGAGSTKDSTEVNTRVNEIPTNQAERRRSAQGLFAFKYGFTVWP